MPQKICKSMLYGAPVGQTRFELKSVSGEAKGLIGVLA
jgi:hypothetical protein